MNTSKVIQLARNHIGGSMESSARLCLRDAVSLYGNGMIDDAKNRAIKSLAYSVGIFHPDYKKATA